MVELPRALAYTQGHRCVDAVQHTDANGALAGWRRAPFSVLTVVQRSAAPDRRKAPGAQTRSSHCIPKDTPRRLPEPARPKAFGSTMPCVSADIRPSRLRKAPPASLRLRRPSSMSGSENPSPSEVCRFRFHAVAEVLRSPAHRASATLRPLRPAPSLALRCGKRTFAILIALANEKAVQHENFLGISC